MAAGRHRSFNEDSVKDSLARLFWQKGYAATSMSDITKVTGLNKPSLYSAFGNKESMFTTSLQWYADKYGSTHAGQLTTQNKPLLDKLTCFFQSIIKMLTHEDLPKGCFICQTTSEMQATSIPNSAQEYVEGCNMASRELFTNVLCSANVEKKRASALADYLMVCQFGLAVSAREGKSFNALKDTVAIALRGISDDIT